MSLAVRWSAFAVIVAACLIESPASALPIGAPVEVKDRKGEEIVVCGRYFNAGTPVVLWTDPGGYDLRRRRPTSERSTTTQATSGVAASTTTTTSPATTTAASDDDLLKDERSAPKPLRGAAVPFDELRLNVDQFVIHYDVAGTAQTCFRVLKRRGLGVQFMCDLDGTLYQTMDLSDSAPHATIANTRSIGVETANIGAYAAEGPIPKILTDWYRTDAAGDTWLTIPRDLPNGGAIREPNFRGKPARPQPVIGNVQGEMLRQYDFTRQQYDALAHVSAALCTVFPKIQPDYPRQRSRLGRPTTGPTTSPAVGDPTTQPDALAEPEELGTLIPHALTRAQFDAFQGIVGHYHVQTDKTDPGPAFQWIPFINRVRMLMTDEARGTNKRYRHQPVITPRAATRPSTNPTTAPTTQPSNVG